MTIQEILSQASVELKAINIDTPSLDASLLLAHILEVDRSKLLAINNEQLSEKAKAEFRSLIDRRKTGECVAYIVGKKEFYGLEFVVNPSVLVPRPDTEKLVETALDILGTGARLRGVSPWGTGNRARLRGVSLQVAGLACAALACREQGAVRILDLCTGSGAIAIALKHELPHLEVYATDISAEALKVAKYNADKILSNNNNISFYQGDLYNALPCYLQANAAQARPATCYLLPSTFYLITSNPPYIPTTELKSLPPEVQKEPQIALDGGDLGLEIIKRIIQDAPNYLVKGGHLLMEADPRQLHSIEMLLTKRGFCNIIKYERIIGGMYE